MNKELGEIFKALKTNALSSSSCIKVHGFNHIRCNTTCLTCPLFQGSYNNYMGNIITTVEVLNEPRTNRDS